MERRESTCQAGGRWKITAQHRNALYLGDNLEILDKIPDKSIDLVYLDPPFNSKKDYNVIFKSETGIPIDQVTAFKDTWTYTAEIKKMVDDFMFSISAGNYSPGLQQLMVVWIKALQESDPEMLAYLVMMVQRIDKLHNKLKETGTLYLHCDPTASHYIKVAMDGIFGRRNFLNEIIWHYQTGGASKNWFSKKHDVIFWYKKTDKYNFYPDKVRMPRTEKSLLRAKTSSGARYDIENDRGKLPMDVWVDVQALNPMSKERLGYPTQKPLPLLERIIKSSCPDDGIILDPFCGCGTAIEAAHKLNRNWIGIDVCKYAVDKIMERMYSNHGLEKQKDYEVYNYPFVFEHIQPLLKLKQGRYIFQDWAVEHIGGISNKTKSGDRGVDGALYFFTSMEKSTYGKMVISVKSDKKLQAQYIRDLVGTMNNQGAEMAGLISYAEPTEGMKLEAAQAGNIEIDMGAWGKQGYQRVQILTAQELLNGKKFETPPTRRLG